MAVTPTSSFASPSLLRPQPPCSPDAFPLLSLSSLYSHLHYLHNHCRCLFFSLAAFAFRQDTSTWTHTALTHTEPTSASLFHVSIDVSDSSDLTVADHYVHLRIPPSAKPFSLETVSPPDLVIARGEFVLLVNRIAGSTVEALCELRRGEVIEIGGVMGGRV